MNEALRIPAEGQSRTYPEMRKLGQIKVDDSTQKALQARLSLAVKEIMNFGGYVFIPTSPSGNANHFTTLSLENAY